ncbi:MAG: response regulator transcription factor [Candidatus Acidiferrales bacterium]
MEGREIPPRSTVRILIADDHAVVRAGLRTLLSEGSQWEVCGEAVNGKDAVEKVQELSPDLVVLDLDMPVMNGFEATREIRRIAPTIKILILSMHPAAQFEVETRRAGADGFVYKGEAPTSLTIAVERLVVGHFR